MLRGIYWTLETEARVPFGIILLLYVTFFFLLSLWKFALKRKVFVYHDDFPSRRES